MILGALVDAGLKVEQLEAELKRLPLSGYRLVIREVSRGGLHGTQVEVQVSEKQTERHLSEIEEIIGSSDLPEQVKTQSKTIFRRLVHAEAQVHGIPLETVHLHEVGAVDALVDVVGAVLGLWTLGVQRVYASPVHVGWGTVECAHGTLPVPAPATLELLRGVPIYGRDIDAELVTPTGAAILTTLAEGFGTAPQMQVEQIGYGAGSRDLPLPNLLRISIGTTTGEWTEYEGDVVTVVETNIDDMNPQWYEHVMEQLFDAGALDVFLIPIQMKRNRPGVQLSVIVAEEHVTKVLAVVFAETTTLGVRLHPVRRWKLERERVVVKTRYGPIGLKVARCGGRVVNVAPEYRECRRIAQERHVPLKEVYQAALEIWRAGLMGDQEKIMNFHEMKGEDDVERA